MSDKKGFSGFDSLMSDVDPDEVLQSIPVSAPEQKSDTSQTTDEKSTIYQQSSAGSSPPNKAKAFWWIAGIIFVIWIISQEDSGTSSSSSSSSSGYSPSSYQSNSYAETESKPPVGQNNVLNRTQIRYCLSQEIRIDTIQNALNNYSDYEVSMYNSLVSDYNSRCGSFRYSSGSLESVKRQVEASRSSITSEGYATVRAWRGQ